MSVLLKEVRVVNTVSPYHDQIVDIHIENGVIRAIGTALQSDAAEVLRFADACVSVGWLDIGAMSCDPGFEHREDLRSLTAAAAAGGYTGVAVWPNTDPCLDSKADILYIRHSAADASAALYPIGAISERCAGKEITEMLDMQTAGAVAFSDGLHSLQSGGLMLRALHYVKAFEGLVINRPLDLSVAGRGQVHEGIVSTSMGTPGIPSLAEELMLSRDIYLLEYTDSRLHVSGISTKGSVELIRQAKARGLKITADVPIANLLYTDAAIEDFDTNYKVMPPLRSVADRKALIDGFVDGTIDLVISNHQPWDEEGKKLEFAYAEFGMTGLETTFAQLLHLLEGRMPLAALADRLALRPRQILGLTTPVIEADAAADLVVYAPEATWTYDRKHIQSKSLNSAVLDGQLRGKVYATMWKDRLYRNPF